MVSAFFEFAELRASRHIPTHMSDYVFQLDNVIKTAELEVLEGAGKISHKQAEDKAVLEYKKYIQENLSPVEKEYLNTIKNISNIAKKKSKGNNDSNGGNS